jgi:hypothetical protein
VQYASRVSVQSSPLEVIEDLENRCVVHAYHFHHTEHSLCWTPVRAVRRDHGQTPQAYLVLSRCAAPSLSFCRRLTRSRADGVSEGEFEATLSEGLPSIRSMYAFPSHASPYTYPTQMPPCNRISTLPSRSPSLAKTTNLSFSPSPRRRRWPATPQP